VETSLTTLMNTLVSATKANGSALDNNTYFF